MSELRVEYWTLPAPDIGPENPLPPLHSGRDIHLAVAADSGVPEDMLSNMAYGRVPSILPYTMQDGYTRARQPRQFRVAVLENEILRAAFFLELGGRLWSLVHKPSGRELLDSNPVFQPANLALRNAWFSGGVEWNIGTTGHWPLTCSPLFAARVERPDGTPVLRMYEWERIRQLAFQVDAYLPEGSPVLFVRVGITNPHDHETPMYWWSNIAVPETPETRVIAPADFAFRFGYKGHGLGRIPVPMMEGIDVSYPTHLDHAADFFFHIPEGRYPWITALDAQGRGLIQTSTRQLRGRKLFLWGMGAGGRKWQEFLSLPGRAYIEIQAGLARTQMEHIPMPAGARWSWVEAYGLLEADADAVHGSSWSAAQVAVEQALGTLVPVATLEAELDRSPAWAEAPPLEMLQRGSGWGALERLRREQSGEPPFCSAGLVFDDASLTETQTPWLGLLRSGAMPASAAVAPRAYMVQEAWRGMLEEAIESGRGAHWLAWLQLGVMRYYINDREGAKQAWEASLEETRTAWALRNLAVLAREDGRLDEACNLYVSACRCEPGLPQLAIECGQTMLDAGQGQAWLDLLADLPEAVRGVGRMRLLEAQAALAVGDLERVRSIFEEKPVVDDMREGEVSLSQLWFQFHERRLSKAEGIPVDDALRARVRRECPVPQEFDFRMHVEKAVDQRLEQATSERRSAMVLDGHVHIGEGARDRDELLRRMRAAGVDGGVLLSLPPSSFVADAEPVAASQRLDDLFAWCQGSSTLYPVFWIDPIADDALDQVAEALERGVAGFKVICDRYYPGDERAIRTYNAIARAARPILFHSGILWDGKPSSRYNRPAEFEALLEVEGLRFALAHISWPWCDEAIAVYGKFQNAITGRSGRSVEMFIDITPGTPPIYRREALTRLFTVGYDIEHNVIFGSDATANAYSAEWVAQWIRRDREILAGLEVAEDVVNGIYGANLLRFLGRSSVPIEKRLLKPAQ